MNYSYEDLMNLELKIYLESIKSKNIENSNKKDTNTITSSKLSKKKLKFH